MSTASKTAIWSHPHHWVMAALRRRRDQLPAAAVLSLARVQTTEQLHEWLNQWTTPADRARLANALRQSAWRSRHPLARITVPRATRDRLKARAEQAGMPLSHFLSTLTETTP